LRSAARIAIGPNIPPIRSFPARPRAAATRAGRSCPRARPSSAPTRRARCDARIVPLHGRIVPLAELIVGK
jgi:hypothetical protein